MAFVFSMGLKTKFHKLILIALLFSSFGDAFLDYKSMDLFPLGMVAFAIAQTIYITAFGLKPFRPILGLVLYMIAAASKLSYFTTMKSVNL